MNKKQWLEKWLQQGTELLCFGKVWSRITVSVDGELALEILPPDEWPDTPSSPSGSVEEFKKRSDAALENSLRQTREKMGAEGELTHRVYKVGWVDDGSGSGPRPLG